MPVGERFDRRTVAIVLIVALLVTSPGFELVVGTGHSMEPRYGPCDLLLVDTLRDTASAVHIGDTVVYRSGSGLIVHDVVGVDVDGNRVWTRGLNREVRERVTSEMLVGVVVAHLDTSVVCPRWG